MFWEISDCDGGGHRDSPGQREDGHDSGAREGGGAGGCNRASGTGG